MTNIMPTIHLETDDLDEISNAVAVTDQTFIQYRKYRFHSEGECHRDATSDGPKLAEAK